MPCASLHYAARLNSSVRPHKATQQWVCRSVAVPASASIFVLRAVHRRAMKVQGRILRLRPPPGQGYCGPVTSASGRAGGWRPRSGTIQRSLRPASRRAVHGRADRFVRLRPPPERGYCRPDHLVACCGLTIRSSRRCFVTQSTWQVQLAMCFAPLRSAA